MHDQTFFIIVTSGKICENIDTLHPRTLVSTEYAEQRYHESFSSDQGSLNDKRKQLVQYLTIVLHQRHTKCLLNPHSGHVKITPIFYNSCDT